MRLFAALALIPALAAGADSDLNRFEWLVGCWVTPDSSSQEVWVIDDERSLVGFGITIDNSKVGSYEVLSIKRGADGSWIYTAHPSGQATASFSATEISENSVVFSNPKHDYPQEIKYQREGSRLYATISLLGGVNAKSFEKINCEEVL